MLFNLESDSVYESEMIKVKSRGINTTACMCCSSLKIRNVYFLPRYLKNVSTPFFVLLAYAEICTGTDELPFFFGNV